MLVRLLLLVLLLAAPHAFALECDPGICVGNPCTITGVHHLAAGCSLDLTGKDVTLAAGASLSQAVVGSGMGVAANSLTVEGTISAVGAQLDIDVTGDLATSGGGTILVRRAKIPGGTVQSALAIDAGGHVHLAGRPVSVGGDETLLRISAGRITVDTTVSAVSRGSVTAIGVRFDANSGPIVTSRPIRTKRSDIAMYSVSDITIGAPIDVREGAVGFISEGGAVSLNARVRVDHFLNSHVVVVAAHDITVADQILARGRGPNGPSVYVGLEVTGEGDITVLDTIDASYRGPSAFPQGGSIIIGPACSVRIASLLDSRTGDTHGQTRITYREHLDVTGATMRTDYALGNSFVCRCADFFCTACTDDPVGVGAATIVPAPLIDYPASGAAALQPCSPSGAFLEPVAD